MRAKWSAISESEVQQAALRGDRGARWYLRDLAAAKAYQRETNAWVWVERSANQGCPPAEYVLASKFLGYPGILPKPADAAEGLKWVQRGLAHGFESAQHRYAELLLDGNLVVPNIAEAIDWLRKAADQGCPRAEFQLAQQYGCGNGEPRSADDTPVALLKRAARSGWGPAQYALGERYRFGLGVEADPAKAVYWYTLSAYRGERDLTRRRAKLESSLTPQDRQKLTDWLARPDAWSD